MKRKFATGRRGIPLLAAAALAAVGLAAVIPVPAHADGGTGVALLMGGTFMGAVLGDYLASKSETVYFTGAHGPVFVPGWGPMGGRQGYYPQGLGGAGYAQGYYPNHYQAPPPRPAVIYSSVPPSYHLSGRGRGGMDVPTIEESDISMGGGMAPPALPDGPMTNAMGSGMDIPPPGIPGGGGGSGSGVPQGDLGMAAPPLGNL
ncbi:MAG: hypothetical protein HQL82_02345 [Magnetococcales bacterium]|nr:hypothetical protein [Magnetococcales bacterium]